MKRLTYLLLALSLLLTACGGRDDDQIENAETPPPAVEPAEVPETVPQEPDLPAPVSPREIPDMYTAYADALEKLLTEQTLPNGDWVYNDYNNTPEEMAQNKFAVYDVDSDGTEELVILYTTDCMAGMQVQVCSYNSETGGLSLQFRDFPTTGFYDNGFILAEASHNQGHAGDALWPYTLYEYQPETDSYQEIAMVDAWEQDFVPDGYPAEADTSSFGVVYYIMTEGIYDTSNPVDRTIYQQWYDGYMGDAQKLEIIYAELTAENIQQLRENKE